MRAGRLRHKVILMAPTEAVTALGEIETGLANLGTYHAEVVSKAHNESLTEGALISTTAYTVYMRYNSTDLSDIPPNAFLVFDGDKLNILSSDMADHRKRMIRIVAEVAR